MFLVHFFLVHHMNPMTGVVKYGFELLGIVLLLFLWIVEVVELDEGGASMF